MLLALEEDEMALSHPSTFMSPFYFNLSFVHWISVLTLFDSHSFLSSFSSSFSPPWISVSSTPASSPPWSAIVFLSVLSAPSDSSPFDECYNRFHRFPINLESSCRSHSFQVYFLALTELLIQSFVIPLSPKETIHFLLLLSLLSLFHIMPHKLNNVVQTPEVLFLLSSFSHSYFPSSLFCPSYLLFLLDF